MIQKVLPTLIESPVSCGKTPILNARLSLKKLDNSINQLSISFFSDFSEEVSQSINFYIQPISALSGNNLIAFVNEFFTKGTYGVADVYPLNGIAKKRRMKITDFMKPLHRREIQQHLDLLNQSDSQKNYVRCLVVDFKDTSGLYSHLKEISETEKTFITFFNSNNSNKSSVQANIHKLIKDNQINYFICEGSLKAHLIARTFISEQSRFLQGSERGRELFCQLCEFLMNGFKQGCEVIDEHGHQYHPNDYIAVVHDQMKKNAEEKTGELMTVSNLLTFYPQYYKELYSDKSEYFELINHLFEANHDEKEGTTIITIKP